MARRYVPAGSAADGTDALALTPADAGWTYCGLRVATLAAGEPRTFETGDSELFVLPLSATGLTVTVGGDTFEVAGRTTVFARVTDFVYVGRDATFTVVSESGGEIALPSARCDTALPARYGAAEDVAESIRDLLIVYFARDRQADATQ